ncbi:hypothetical protein [Marinitoga lauensis]|uniref:hypothetical protein n=1 Tax=Marinitoga lauensis TaxID=2201189 RepID=UPI001011C54E|nr:hypothetical protein [Marinitoga lauensis]
MKCQLCKKNDAIIVQKFYYDGILTKIGYCQKCLKEISRFHISPVKKGNLQFFGTNIFFKNKFDLNKKNIDFKNIKSKIFIEQPLFIKRILFVEDKNSKIRDSQTLIKRGLDFWTNEYEKAKEEYNTEKMKAIEDIIEKIKKLL